MKRLINKAYPHISNINETMIRNSLLMTMTRLYTFRKIALKQGFIKQIDYPKEITETTYPLFGLNNG